MIITTCSQGEVCCQYTLAQFGHPSLSSAGVTRGSAALSGRLAFLVVRSCVSVYALALWTSASSPLPPKRSCIACLPPCVRRPAATGPVRRRRVVPATRADYQRGFVESYPASWRVVVILSLPRSPCSARRSDTFLDLGPWTRPDPRQLCKTPCGGKQSPTEEESFRSDGVLFVGGKVVWCGLSPAYWPALHVAASNNSYSCTRVPRPSAAPSRLVILPARHRCGCCMCRREGRAPWSIDCGVPCP